MSSNWWADKLGAPQQPSAPRQAPQQPVSYPPTTPQPVYLPPEVRQHQLPASATTSSRCPECGSGNYGGATPEARKRCYDCGYPITQSGSGMGKGIMGGPQASGPTQPARQAATGTGFNPQTIIGHI